ncbi:hypothetical protein Q7G06_11405 [Acinetobacter baumannii]|nr:hypothetical protein [Acinetobacter baumannii]
MDNYKIKVKDEAESKEAQELLFSLEYRWGTQSETKPIHLDKPFLYTNEAFIEFGESLSIFREALEKELTIAELHVLAAAKQPQDPALISGAEALRALADGKEVEYFDKLNGEWDSDTSILPINVFTNGSVKFRLKPQTIKLELELPKPFEPKLGEMYWWIDATSEEGYSYTYFDNNKADQDIMQFGAYRTEDEIKQVVEQLRKIRGTNS